MMKRTAIIALMLLLLISGVFAKSKQLSESAGNFCNEAKVNLVIPMRFYTWIKIPYSKNVTKDITSGIFDFTYDKDSNYLVKGIKTENGIMSYWGNQVLIQDEQTRFFLVTAFIASAYAQVNEKDSIDVAFDVLKQIFADDAYKDNKVQLADVLKIGLEKYIEGGDSWTNYKNEHFINTDGAISIKQ